MVQVENHTEVVFLARLSLRSGLNILHHFIQVGGKCYSNEKNSDFILDLNKITVVITIQDTYTILRTSYWQTYEVRKVEDI